MKNHLAIFAALLVVSGCSTTSLQRGQDVAPKTTQPSQSASGGGRVGTGFIAAMNGGLVGGNIGSGLTAQEKRSGLEAEYKALEYTASGQPVAWKGDQANHYGEVVAAQPYRVGSQDCRQYRHTVTAGGPAVTARGTACRNADGSWTPLT
ncbi:MULTISPECIES: hypothetical protein [unclassified Mesorhizobium]|uniref:hypothetical protein n=1 Tax=unclassified Mesorhizobium TaxID=325217 RepID=UPI0006F289F3|nr:MULTISPECIES: hypothetical protein [unclassified Mesorhizobium]KQZ12970.1 hypothetical protein ASD27_01970 [Mesorhizobium sp. Root1471]KQZ35489.1 hypothetical protein ASD44_01965 [Mesorhizobium sp. Root554]MDR7031734.1 surface antigen [Mesorhizobium sp. BE184]